MIPRLLYHVSIINKIFSILVRVKGSNKRRYIVDSLKWTLSFTLSRNAINMFLTIADVTILATTCLIKFS